MTNVTRGVILAAGRGSRMAPFSERIPKPLLPICNVPLIQRQLQIMKSLGIHDIVVLVGHRGFEISRQLGDGSALGVKLTYVEQSTYLGIAHAVGCLEPYLSGPFLLFLGDIFFTTGKLDRMLSTFDPNSGGAILAVKDEPDPVAMSKNYAVVVGDNGLVKRVIEKPRIAPCNVKGVGVYLFDLTIFDAIRRTPRTAMRDEYEITHSIQVLIDDGYPVHAVNAINDDVNLTFPADLLRCNLHQAKLLLESSIKGERNSIHPGAQLVDCVVGSDVTIEHPIRISRSMIFTGSRVTSTVDFDSYIVTPDGMVDCNV
jgi:dTDP-glucose pyrophosphorylase